MSLFLDCSHPPSKHSNPHRLFFTVLAHRALDPTTSLLTRGEGSSQDHRPLESSQRTTPMQVFKGYCKRISDDLC